MYPKTASLLYIYQHEPNILPSRKSQNMKLLVNMLPCLALGLATLVAANNRTFS
jgi:hypothetical protein